MKKSLSAEVRYLFPVWLACILLPLPALAVWRSAEGRSDALFLFSIGCASLVAYAFHRDVKARASEVMENPERTWQERMKGATVALYSAWAIFSVASLTLNDAQDWVEVALAFLIPIPALCVVPFFLMLTRKATAAVVFGVFTVFCMKLLGCVVVVLVYGWHADRHVPPYTDMPWTHPNLLVWLFWFNTAVLSTVLYVLGRKKYLKQISMAPLSA